MHHCLVLVVREIGLVLLLLKSTDQTLYILMLKAELSLSCYITHISV